MSLRRPVAWGMFLTSVAAFAATMWANELLSDPRSYCLPAPTAEERARDIAEYRAYTAALAASTRPATRAVGGGEFARR